jgi:hypothetical protein
MAVLTILAVTAPMALFYVAQRQWGRSFLEGLLVALFLDLNWDSTFLILVGATGVIAYTAWRRSSLLGPISIFASIILITTLLGIGVRPSWISATPGQSPDRIESSKPTILHVILDEHVGVEGLPRDDKEALRLREILKRYYVNSGYSLYGGAYSEHFFTVNSIPDILNFGHGNVLGAKPGGFIVGPTEYFRLLKENGYKITIFQSDYADYCKEIPFQECITYDSSALGPTLAAPTNTSGRAHLLLFKLMKLSKVAELSVDAWNMAAAEGRKLGWSTPELFLSGRASSSSVGTIEALRTLEQRVAKARPGEAYFAHLLLPHTPFVVDAHCTYLPGDRWVGRDVKFSLIEQRHAYYQQVECATRQIDRLSRALSRSPAGKNFIVIVHGDHGSRITNIPPVESNIGIFKSDDLIAGFSTLFAVKIRGFQGRYADTPQPIASLLEEAATSGFRTPPSTHHAIRPVQLNNSNWQPHSKVNLPADWTARLNRPHVVRQQTGHLRDDQSRIM